MAIIDAPSNLGLAPPNAGAEPGVSLAPAALRSLGLAAALGALDGGCVPAAPYQELIDADTGIRNVHAIAQYIPRLANAVERQLARDRFPIVVGGDCSVLLGSLLALRRRGRFGLGFIDGHRDLLTPATSTSGGAAGMDLALAVGCGPRLLTAPEGLVPLVAPSDVVVLGDRDHASWSTEDDVESAWQQMRHRDLNELRLMGVERSAEWALTRWRDQEVRGVWLHLDVDVLDSTVMPAVDSPEPGGLGYAELAALLTPMLHSGLVVGLEITIYDPERDTVHAGARLVRELVDIVWSADRSHASITFPRT